MAGHRRPWPLALTAMATAVLAVACAGTPRPQALASGVDFGPIAGSWTATVRGDGIWQGRWELHLQGGSMLLVQPDGELIVPGTVDAFGPGALVLGPTLACDSNVDGVRRGVYTYELTTDGLRLESGEDGDGCLDRAVILAAAAWVPSPRRAMPIRLDVPPHPSCDPPPAASDDTASASAETALPVPWVLENATAGVVVVVDVDATTGSRTLVATAPPGGTVTVDPQRGGTWTISDLPGQCLARVAAVDRVRLRTGAMPVIERDATGS